MIVLKNVVKRYNSHLAVDHLDLSINKGEVYGLLGPNGAGKSTTIKLICGLLKSDQGEIRLDGIDVNKHPLEAKRRLGFVPQELAIYEALSAKENVTFFGKLHGLRGAILNERVSEALEFVGLQDRQKDLPSSYSGGMKRRLNIACAIVHEPKVLIMDEPTVGIDPQSRNHILESVKTLHQRGATIIYTSHYMEEVEAISDRVGIIDEGRLIISGTQDELKEKVQNQEKISILVSKIEPKAIEELQSHPNIQRVEAVEDHLDSTLEIYLQNSSLFLQDILFILSNTTA